MLVVVGRIVRAHGIRGEVLVDVRTDEPGRRLAVGETLRAGSRVLTIRAARAHGERIRLAFSEVPDRNQAEELQGAILEAEVDPEETPEDAEEFYDRQLVGITVQDAAGRDRGVVTGVLHLPAQDTLVIDVDGTEVLIPFVSELVPHVDLPGGVMRVADVAGLLSPGESE